MPEEIPCSLPRAVRSGAGPEGAAPAQSSMGEALAEVVRTADRTVTTTVGVPPITDAVNALLAFPEEDLANLLRDRATRFGPGEGTGSWGLRFLEIGGAIVVTAPGPVDSSTGNPPRAGKAPPRGVPRRKRSPYEPGAPR